MIIRQQFNTELFKIPDMKYEFDFISGILLLQHSTYLAENKKLKEGIEVQND